METDTGKILQNPLDMDEILNEAILDVVETAEVAYSQGANDFFSHKALARFNNRKFPDFFRTCYISGYKNKGRKIAISEAPFGIRDLAEKLFLPGNHTNSTQGAKMFKPSQIKMNQADATQSSGAGTTQAQNPTATGALQVVAVAPAKVTMSQYGIGKIALMFTGAAAIGAAAGYYVGHKKGVSDRAAIANNSDSSK